MKFKIKEFTRKYSSEKKIKDVTERSDLERKLKNLPDILNTNSSDETIKEYEDCKNKRLESFYDSITKGLILRSKAEWYEKGEKSNKYFCNLEKRSKSKTHVHSLIIGNTETHDHVTITQVLISSITIPPRTPGDLHQKFAPTLGLLHPSFALGGDLLG